MIIKTLLSEVKYVFVCAAILFRKHVADLAVVALLYEPCCH